MTVFLAVFVMALAVYLLAIITDEYFIVSLDQISRRLNIPTNVAGASLMAVGSSAPKANLDLVFERVKIRDYFNACVTGEEVVEGKPAPETFIKAAQKLGLRSDCCVVVEDAVQGVEAGKAAGMSVVAVTTTRDRSALSAADIIVDGLGELNAKDFAKLLKD